MPRESTGRRYGALTTALLGICALDGARAADVIFAADFQSSNMVQWVRHHAPMTNGPTISLGPVFVSATVLTNSNTFLTMFVQVPDGLNTALDYPAWSALETFGSASGPTPAVGDCVRVEGAITSFKGAIELSSATWSAAPGGCGNVPLAPYVFFYIADVATDSDPATSGNQPGASAEALESVLLKVESGSPHISTSNNSGIGPFNVVDDVTGPDVYLAVDDFIYGFPAVAGTQLQSITGVLERFDSASDPVYQLLPRSAGDVIVAP